MCPTGTSNRPSSPTSLRSTFDILDVDYDGKISHSDLQSFYTIHLISSSSDVIRSKITLFNRDYFVQYDEFEKVLEANDNNGRYGSMEDEFKVMDKDGDGKFGIADLKSYLSLAGLEASEDDIMAMVNLGDVGGNGGGVSYDRFLKILAV